MSDSNQEQKGRSLTDLPSLLGDLNAGVFQQQIERALSDVAAGVVTTGKVGEVTIKLKLSQIGDGAQVKCSHGLKAVIPRHRGRTTEENEVDTPLHVSHGGKLTLFPEQNSFEMGAGAATGRTDGVHSN